MMATDRKVLLNYVPLTVLLLVGLSQGLPGNKLNLRQKRNTPNDHTNIVNVFLSELENNQNLKDVIFVLDRSYTVGHKNFYLKQKQLLSTLIRQYFAIKPGDFNLAVITFGRDVTTVIDYISQNTASPLKCDFVEKSHILDKVQYIDGEVSDGGVNIKGAYQAAINIFRNSKAPSNKQIMVAMTGAQYKDADAPIVELGELYLVPVFGVAIGHDFSDVSMRQATHYHANFTYWRQRTLTTDYHVAHLKYPEYHPYPSGNCNCGSFGTCYCDIITGYSKCQCNKGYTMDTSGQCVACPQGFFKESVGNGPCESCPNEASIALSPVPGTAYHSSCYCFNTYYNQWMQCPDLCRTNPYDPNSDKYCTQARQCVRDQTITNAAAANFKCECLDGRTGMFCNQDIQECVVQNCANGGTCVEGHSQAACVCQWGFTGRLCEKRMDECRNPNACPKKSTCHQRVPDNYECICKKGYSHHTCVHEDCLFKQCGPNGTVTGQKESSEVDKSTGAASGTFSGATKLMVIIMPPCTAAIVIIVISVAALLHLRKKGRGRHEKDVSNMTETTSVISRNPSLITFDSKCYQDEGTPALPNVANNFYDFDDSVYGNEPLQKGMDEWYAYVLAVVHNNNLTRLTVVRLDGEKWVLSPGCRVSLSETKSLFNIISSKVYSKIITIQGRDFGIVNNEDFVIVAHSIGKDGQDHEIACATKTRQFVITATALFQGDHGRCRQEIEKLRDHIKQQGL